MIKPCIGFEIEDGAKIFYNTALGGVDFIKDDELLGNPDFCPLKNRVRAYVDASEKAFEITGKRTLYIPNITDHVAKLIDNAKIAEENGSKSNHAYFASVGLSRVTDGARSGFLFLLWDITLEQVRIMKALFQVFHQT